MGAHLTAPRRGRAVARASACAALSLSAWLASAPAHAATPGETLTYSRETVIRAQPGAVLDVAQDESGFLWLATARGLQRFDGVAFRLHRVSDDLPQLPDGLRRVYASLGGGLLAVTGVAWLGLDEGRVQVGWRRGSSALVRFDGRHFTRIDVEPHDVEDAVWTLAETSSDDLWLGGEAGLAHVVGKRVVKRWTTAEGLPDAFVTALLVERGASGPRLLVGTASGLAVLDISGGRLTPTGVREPILALTRDVRGGVYVGTTKGLFRFFGSEQLQPLQQHQAVTAIAIAQTTAAEPHVWVGTEAGLAVIDPHAPDDAWLTPELAGTAVARLFADREGSVWASTQTLGLVQQRARRTWNLGAPEGHAPLAFATLAAPDGSVWVSTSKDLVRWRGDRLSRYPLGTTVPTWSPRGMAMGADGVLWIATWNDGLVRMRDERFERVPLAEAGGMSVRSVFVAASGDLWLSPHDGGLIRYPGAHVSPLPPGKATPVPIGRREGLCATPIVAMAEAPDGRLWAATESGGLAWVHEGSSGCVAVGQGVQNHLSTVAVDAEGNAWAGAANEPRLSRVLPDLSLEHHRVREGVGGISGIVDDGRGHLWLATDGGVLRVNKSELARADRVVEAEVRFGHADGMRTEQVTANFQSTLSLAPDGRAWVATHRGITVLANPDRLPVPNLAPRFDEAFVGNVPLRLQETLTLPHDAATLTLRLAVPTYLWPEHIRFATRTGGSTDWATLQSRDLTFPRLSPGRHVVSVRAITTSAFAAGGVASLQIVVKPPWWKTAWAFATCAIAALAAGYVVHRLRVRRVAEQHRLIEEERRRLARDLHDTLAQGFASTGYHLDALGRRLKQTFDDTQVERELALIGRTRTVLEQVRLEARRLIWDLRNEPDAETTCLSRSCESLQSSFPGLAVDVAVDRTLKLEPRVAHELQQIIREALVNASRHGHASHARIESEDTASGVVIRIIDDGRGIAAEDVRASTGDGGFGLLGMRERAKRIGGILSLHNRSDGQSGVVVSVTFGPRGIP